MARKPFMPIFPGGRVKVTTRAKTSVSSHDVRQALRRQAQNTAEIAAYPNGDGCRFLAAYRSSRNRTFWIITEADRLHTTVLLPEEFPSR
jgi:hypothetical protein